MQTRSLDIGRAIAFMFEEEDWIKKAGILLLMIVLGGFILPAFIAQGYVLEVAQRVARDQRPLLPEWDDWGGYLSRGFMAALAQFIYFLPLVIPIFCLAAFLIGASSAASESSEAAGALAGGTTLLFCCLGIITLLTAIPLSMLYYVGLVRYLENGEFGTFFQFGRNWATLSQNLRLYGAATLTIIVTALAGGFIPLVGTVWAYLVMGHVLGQLLPGNATASRPLETPLPRL